MAGSASRISGKRCSKCGEMKPRSEYHRDRQKRDGLSLWCKSCRNANSAAWREERGDDWKARREEERRRAEYEPRFD